MARAGVVKPSLTALLVVPRPCATDLQGQPVLAFIVGGRWSASDGPITACDIPGTGLGATCALQTSRVVLGRVDYGR